MGLVLVLAELLFSPSFSSPILQNQGRYKKNHEVGRKGSVKLGQICSLYSGLLDKVSLSMQLMFAI